jgi:hypothetical protein
LCDSISDDCRWDGDRMRVRLPGSRNAVIATIAEAVKVLPVCREQSIAT